MTYRTLGEGGDYRSFNPSFPITFHFPSYVMASYLLALFLPHSMLCWNGAGTGRTLWKTALGEGLSWPMCAERNYLFKRQAWSNTQPTSPWPFGCTAVITSPKWWPAPLIFVIFQATSGSQWPWQLTEHKSLLFLPPISPSRQPQPSSGANPLGQVHCG